MITQSFPTSNSDLKAVDFEQLADDLLIEVPVLVDKIIKGAEVKKEEVKVLLTEVLRFLFLIGTTNQKLTPSHIVDMAWHEFILCPWLYHKFCDEHFKRFIHHHPGGKEESNHQQFHLTHQAYHLLIGTPPQRFWGRVSQAEMQSGCGACEAI